MKKITTILLSTLAIGSTLSASQVLFVDSFDNGIVTQSDEYSSYWSVGSMTTTATESGGKLRVLLPGGSGSAQTLSMRSHNNGGATSFNFFETPTTFTLSDFSVANIPVGEGQAGNNPQNSLFHFLISPSDEANPTSTGNVNTAFGIRIRANNAVTYGVKAEGQGDLFGLGEVTTGSDQITGVSITLDSTNYSIALTTTAGALDLITGEHGLTIESWGANGQADMGLVVQSFLSSGTSNQTQFELGQITVTAIPEPRTYGMLAGLLVLGGAMLKRKRK